MLQTQAAGCGGALAILHHSSVSLMVRLQHAVSIRRIIQKSEVNLLWFYGFLLSLGSWEFLDDSQSIYSIELLYGGAAWFLTNVKSMCRDWWISLTLNSDSTPSVWFLWSIITYLYHAWSVMVFDNHVSHGLNYNMYIERDTSNIY